MLKKKYYGLIVVFAFLFGIILSHGTIAEAAKTVEEDTIKDELVTTINLNGEDRVKMIELGFY